MNGQHNAQLGGFRDRVLRMARSTPNLNVDQIAHRVGCHPDTVHKHLRHLPSPDRRWPAGAYRHRRTMAFSTTSPATLTRLVADPDPDVRLEVAKHPVTPAAVRVRCASDSARRVQIAAAENARTPPVALTRLAKRGDSGVRTAVAANEACPPSLLRLLGRDSDTWTRSKVAMNPLAPLDLLEQLAEDPDETVRMHVRSNPRCTNKLRARIETEAFGPF